MGPLIGFCHGRSHCCGVLRFRSGQEEDDGYCPGPALVSMATGQPKALLFVLAMLAGMGVFSSLNPPSIPSD